MEDRIVLTPEAAGALVASILAAAGVGEADAATTARCLVRADLRGVDTHGIVRLPGYVDRIRKGLIAARPDLSPRRVTRSVAHLDGQDGLGFVVASRAMDEAIAMAGEEGLGLVGVSRSGHFGMAATYLLQAVEQGFAALVFTNASRAMPPWGGREEMFGTSPFGAAAPGADGVHFVLDMAPTVVARGKIRKALREGRSIPEGYALDREGRPTTDPAAALEGVLMPIGGAKGAGLSMLMDILCGVLTGAAYAGGVGDQYKNFERPQNVGHFILALRPDLFVSRDEFAARMGHLVSTVKDNPKADGFEEILMPGEPEARIEAERRRNGIPYRRVDLEPLVALAREQGIAPPPGLD